MLNLYYRVWSIFRGEMLGATNYIPMPLFLRKIINKKTSMRAKVISYARVLIGTKVYRNVDPEVACANVVTGILELVDPSFFGGKTTEDRINGTYTLSENLAKNPRFKRFPKPQPACIVLSPTGKGYAGKVGHTGYVDLDGFSIISNDSYSGRLRRNYNINSWNKRYQEGFGIPTEYYIITN